MKSSRSKENVVKPMIIAIAVTLLGVILLIYQAFFAKKPSVMNYVMSGLAAAVGVLLVIASILRMVKIRGEEKVLALGERTMATFISYDTIKSSGKVAVYYVEYSYELDGKKYICKSPSQFNWYEVLTLKVVGRFPVRTYKGKSVLDCNIAQMHLDNIEAVAELNRKYEQAIDEFAKK